MQPIPSSGPMASPSLTFGEEVFFSPLRAPIQVNETHSWMAAIAS